MTNSTERIACPKCRANNFLGQTNCWQCGSSLPPPDAAPRPAAYPPPAQPAALPPQAYSAAGYPPQAQPSLAHIQPPVPRARGSRILLAVIGLLGISVLGLGWYVVSHRQAAAGAAGDIQVPDWLRKTPSSVPAPNDTSPEAAEARRMIDQLNQKNPYAQPQTSGDGQVHLRGGGSLSPEEFERYRSSIGK